MEAVVDDGEGLLLRSLEVVLQLEKKSGGAGVTDTEGEDPDTNHGLGRYVHNSTLLSRMPKICSTWLMDIEELLLDLSGRSSDLRASLLNRDVKGALRLLSSLEAAVERADQMIWRRMKDLKRLLARCRLKFTVPGSSSSEVSRDHGRYETLLFGDGKGTDEAYVEVFSTSSNSSSLYAVYVAVSAVVVVILFLCLLKCVNEHVSDRAKKLV